MEPSIYSWKISERIFQPPYVRNPPNSTYTPTKEGEVVKPKSAEMATKSSDKLQSSKGSMNPIEILNSTGLWDLGRDENPPPAFPAPRKVHH